MSVTDFALLFIIGFIVGLFGRLIYARLTGRLGPANPQNKANVRYIEPRVDASRTTTDDTALHRKAGAETDVPDEQEQQYPKKKAANQ